MKIEYSKMSNVGLLLSHRIGSDNKKLVIYPKLSQNIQICSISALLQPVYDIIYIKSFLKTNKHSFVIIFS